MGGNKVKFVQRLGDLFHEGGYLNRPRQQWDTFNANCTPAVYEITEAGEHLLRQLGLQAENVSGLVRRGRMGATRQFHHALMTCDALASIELGLRDTPGVRFISWQEIIERAPEQTRSARNPFALSVRISNSFSGGREVRASFNLIPDGLFGLEYTENGDKSYRFFALEAERTNRVYCSNLNQTSWLKKTLAYRDVAARSVHRTQLGVPNLLTLVVTPTPSRIRSMQRLILEVTKGKGSSTFLFQPLGVRGSAEFTAEPMLQLAKGSWERAGHQPIRIDKP